MLLIQQICLTWYQSQKGGKAASIRSGFLKAYPIVVSKIVPTFDCCLHNQSFYQTNNQIVDAKTYHTDFWNRVIKQELDPVRKESFRWRCIRANQWAEKCEYQHFGIEELDVEGVRVSLQPDGYHIGYYYDQQRSGRPYRRGHNKDFWNRQSPFFGKDICNETAFVLSQNQYGRICFNKRNIDMDTGAWWYQLHIVNLIAHFGDLTAHLFTKRQPDFEYRQLADLF